uniref:Outer mitochondrial transmembrane helix translocase n=1 Tax=Takifugu rubripes TaxID=31033 RepID=A0A674PNT2_TAKRU
MMVLREVPVENITRPIGRNEVIGLLFRLTIFGAVTYFTIKWMVDAIDPTRKQKVEAQKQAEKLMRQIGVKNVKLSEYEMSIAAHLVDPLSLQITWTDIAGLDDVITELKETVILPVQKRHLFQNSRLLQPPKGVLLYGPPGCGKTLIAKATAKEAGFRFINLQPSTLTDKWYGESQKLAAAVFSLAVKLQPSIIFIDEIDSFLRSRSSSDHEATAMMKAQFMSLWDGLDTDSHLQVIIMGATNRPQDLDSAILRRMPSRFHINQPSVRQREQILRLILENEKVSLPRTVGSQTTSQPVSVSSDHPCRLTRLLTSAALPWKQKASQEVTSERCVGTLHCCACGTLCTCRATGSSWTRPSVCVTVHRCIKEVVSRGVAALHLSVCLSVSQANRRISPFHQSLRSSEIHHQVEEVKVGGRSRCSAARGSGLTAGHMTTSQVCCHPRVCTGVDGAVVVSPLSSLHAGVINIMDHLPAAATTSRPRPIPRLRPRGSYTLDMKRRYSCFP